jgi:hypothetical protein
MHRKTLCLASLLLGALAVLPSHVVGQQKKNTNQPMAATDQDYVFLEQAKQVTGQILSFDDSAKTVSVRVDGAEWVPNPKYKPMGNQYAQLSQHQTHLAQETQRLAAAKTRAQAQTHMRQIAHLQGQIGQEMGKLSNVNPNNLPFTSIKHTRDFDLTLQDNIVYRKMNLTLEYDDTGNAKTLTKEEIAKLKGTDSSKPGYKATASEFHANQVVFIYVSPAKKSTSSSSTSSKEDKDGKEKTDTVALDRPTVRMLIIDKDGAAPATITPAPKKKN